MAGAWSTICRSTAAQAAPALAGSETCRLRARSILPSSSWLQNSEMFSLLPLLGTSGTASADAAPYQPYSEALIAARPELSS
jgi:hypothetical protein